MNSLVLYVTFVPYKLYCRGSLIRLKHVLHICVALHQGKMSAEAADRVAAVASSRPGTPLQTSWFEFLLDSSLLEKHLQKINPGHLSFIFIKISYTCDHDFSLTPFGTHIGHHIVMIESEFYIKIINHHKGIMV